MPVETGNVLLLCAAAAGNSYSDGHEWSVAQGAPPPPGLYGRPAPGGGECYDSTRVYRSAASINGLATSMIVSS